MTIRETIVLVRTLLDDGIDWYNTRQHVVEVINEAQLRMIDYWVTTNNERALRPLFFWNDWTQDVRNNFLVEPLPIRHRYMVGDTEIIRKPLYIRNCLVYLNQMLDSQNVQFSLHANYMPLELFLNNEGNLSSFVGNFSLGNPWISNSMPQNLYYSIERKYANNEWDSWLLFTYGDVIEDSKALVSFVAEPLPFGPTQELEVAPEYHYEVCVQAAEMLNSNDVGERNRSKVAVAEFGQKLDMLVLGTTDG